MKTTQYLLTLRQPVIISEKSASVGAHQSLDYIKGSTLLGLLASRLYAQLSAEDAFLLFHSGKVRFNDALPVTEGSTVAYPVPMCLHSFKAEKYADGQALLADKIFDISKVAADDGLKESMKEKQPVQLRNFYITVNGHRISPEKEQTLKTAIDPKQNRAQDAQLFGYEALSAHQQFGFSIDADDDVSDALINKLSAIVGAAHLGRSRSAQFGAVDIVAQALVQPTQTPPKAQQHLSLWLISDMQLQKEGQPTLIPEPHVLGLPEGTTWLPKASFLRTRRYSVYNAYRRHYDKERQVISRGSVLRYELPADFDQHKELYQRLAKGIGVQTESGLGQVWINPDLLANTRPDWQPLKNAKHTAAAHVINSATQPKNSLLLETVLRKQQVAEIGSKPRQTAAKIFAQLCEKIVQARRYQGLVRGMPLEPSPPSRAQFGRFKELANQHRNAPDKLWQELVTNKNAVLKVTTENENDNRQRGASYKRAGWELKYAPSIGASASLGQFLQDELKAYKDKSYFAYIIAELGTLGLSETWDAYCIGYKPTAQERQQQAAEYKEHA